MSFTSPIWLLGLLPWAGLVIWLLWGRRRRVGIPFLELWAGPIVGPKAKRWIQSPPLAMLAALVTIFLAILASAQPRCGFFASPDGSLITIIVDRGIMSSASGASGGQLGEVWGLAGESISQNFGSGPMDFIAVPQGEVESMDRADLIAAINRLSLTSVDTSAKLRAIVLQRLADSTSPVIVLSDQSLNIEEDRLIQIPSETPLQNIGLVRLAAREFPKPQLMVRIRNQSSRNEAMLRIQSDGQTVENQINLPDQNGEQNYFVDLPRMGPIIEASIKAIDPRQSNDPPQAIDPLPADNRAWLVRQRSWPAVEARSSLPAELRRMIDVYTKLRPPGEASTRVAVVASLFQLPKDLPAAAVLTTTGVLTTTSPNPATTRNSAPLRVVDHPLTAEIDWRAAAADASITAAPGDGWTPLVSRGDRVLVAAREAPVRQVWAGFYSPDWPRSADYVIFWTKVFDWLGEGGELFASDPIQRLGEEWKQIIPSPANADKINGLTPGVYRRPDGAMRAINAMDVKVDPAFPTGWRPKLSAAAKSMRQGRDLTAFILIFAIAGMAASAMLWRRNNLTGFSETRTV